MPEIQIAAYLSIILLWNRISFNKSEQNKTERKGSRREEKEFPGMF